MGFIKLKRKKVSSAWLATFADLASLMITFFVLLFSMKEVDAPRWSAVSDALSDVFSQETSVKPKLFGGEDAQSAFINAGSLTYLQAILERRFQGNKILRQAGLIYNVEAQTLTIELPSLLLFNVGEAALQPQAQQALEQLATFLQNIENKIIISGHTDPTPLREGGAYATNWELSMMRALSVLKKLRSSGVVAPMDAVGFADSRFYMLDSELPLVKRYAKARRVEITISQKAANAKEQF